MDKTNYLKYAEVLSSSKDGFLLMEQSPARRRWLDSVFVQIRKFLVEGHQSE
jgi:hypothetical protein